MSQVPFAIDVINAPVAINASTTTATEVVDCSLVINPTNDPNFISEFSGTVRVDVSDVSINGITHEFTISNVSDLNTDGSIDFSLQITSETGKNLQDGMPISTLLTLTLTDSSTNSFTRELAFTSIVSRGTISDASLSDVLVANQFGEVLYMNEVPEFDGSINELQQLVKEQLNVILNVDTQSELRVENYREKFEIDICGIKYTNFKETNDTTGGLYRSVENVEYTNNSLADLFDVENEQLFSKINVSVPGYYKVTYRFKDDAGEDIDISINGSETNTFTKELVFNVPLVLSESYTFTNPNKTTTTRDDLAVVELPFTFGRKPLLSLDANSGFRNANANAPLFEHLAKDIIQVDISGTNNSASHTDKSYEDYQTLIKSGLSRGSREKYDVSFTYVSPINATYPNKFFELAFNIDASGDNVFDSTNNYTVDLINTTQVKFVPYKADEIRFILVDENNNQSVSSLYNAVVESSTLTDACLNFVDSEIFRNITDQTTRLSFLIMPWYYQPDTSLVDVSMTKDVFVNSNYSVSYDASQILYKRHAHDGDSYGSIDISYVADSGDNIAFLDVALDGPVTIDVTLSINNTVDIEDYSSTSDNDIAVGHVYTKQLVIDTELNSSDLSASDISLTNFDFQISDYRLGSANVTLPTMKQLFDTHGSSISYEDAIDGSYNFADDYDYIFEEALVGNVAITYYNDVDLSNTDISTVSVNKRFNEVESQNVSDLSGLFGFEDNSTNNLDLLRIKSIDVSLTVTNSSDDSDSFNVHFDKYVSDPVSITETITSNIDLSGTYPTLLLPSINSVMSAYNSRSDISGEDGSIYVTNVSITSYNTAFDASSTSQDISVNRSIEDISGSRLSGLSGFNFTGDVSNAGLLRIAQIDIDAHIFTLDACINKVHLTYTDFDVPLNTPSLSAGSEIELDLSYNRDFVGLTTGTGRTAALYALNTHDTDSNYNNGVSLFNKLHSNNIRMVDHYFRVFDLSFTISTGSADTDISFIYQGVSGSSLVEDTATGVVVPTATLTLNYYDKDNSSNDISAVNTSFEISSADTIDLVMNKSMNLNIELNDYDNEYPSQHNGTYGSLDLSDNVDISLAYETIPPVTVSTPDISARSLVEYYEDYTSALENADVSYTITQAFSNTDMNGVDVCFTMTNVETSTAIVTEADNNDLVKNETSILDNNYNRYSVSLSYFDQRVTYVGTAAATSNPSIVSDISANSSATSLVEFTQPPEPHFTGSTSNSIQIAPTTGYNMSTQFLETMLEGIHVNFFTGDLSSNLTYNKVSLGDISSQLVFIDEIKFFYDFNTDDNSLAHAVGVVDTEVLLTTDASNHQTTNLLVVVNNDGAKAYKDIGASYEEVTLVGDLSVNRLINQEGTSYSILNDTLFDTNFVKTHVDSTATDISPLSKTLLRIQVRINVDISDQESDISALSSSVFETTSSTGDIAGATLVTTFTGYTDRTLFASAAATSTTDIAVYDLSGTSAVSTNSTRIGYKVQSATSSSDATSGLLYLTDGSASSFVPTTTGIDVEFGANTIQVTLDENFTNGTGLKLTDLTTSTGVDLIDLLKVSDFRILDDISGISSITDMSGYMGISAEDVKRLILTGKTRNGEYVKYSYSGSSLTGESLSIKDAILNYGLDTSNNARVYLGWQLVPETDNSYALFTHVYDNIITGTSTTPLPVSDPTTNDTPQSDLPNYYSNDLCLNNTASTINVKQISITDVSYNVSSSTLTTTDVSLSVSPTNVVLSSGNTLGFGFDNLLDTVILDNRRPGKYKFVLYLREGAAYTKNFTPTGEISDMSTFDANNTTIPTSGSTIIPATSSSVDNVTTISNTLSRTSVMAFNVIVRSKDNNLLSVVSTDSVDVSLTIPDITTTYNDSISKYMDISADVSNTLLFDVSGEDNYLDDLKLNYTLKITDVYSNYYNVYNSDRLTNPTAITEDYSHSGIGLTSVSGLGLSKASGIVKLYANDILTYIHNNDMSLNISTGPIDISLSWNVTHDLSFITGKLHDDVTTLHNTNTGAVGDIDMLEPSDDNQDASGIISNSSNGIIVLPSSDGTDSSGTINIVVNDTEAPQLILYDVSNSKYAFTYTTTNVDKSHLTSGSILTDISGTNYMATMSDNHLAGVPSDASENIVIITNVTKLDKNTYALDNLYNISRSFDLQITATDASAQHLLIRESLDNCGNGIDISSGRVPILRAGSLHKLGINESVVDNSNVLIVEYVGYGAQGNTFIRTEPKFLVIDASRGDDGVKGVVTAQQLSTSTDARVFYDDQGETTNMESIVEADSTNRFGLFFN